MKPPEYTALWQCVGMLVMVYALGYYLVARQPERFAGLVLIGLLGKVLGPIGFLYAAATHQLPWRFGICNLTNDVIWIPVFLAFSLQHCRDIFACETTPSSTPGEAAPPIHDQSSPVSPE
jgi:hypothetical protein